MNLILLHPRELDDASRVTLTDERAEHIRSVLHAVPGQTVRIGILDGPLGFGTVEQISRAGVSLLCALETPPLPRPRMDILLALPRPKVLKRLWAQLAALGVGRIFLTNAEKVERCYFDSHVLEPDFFQRQLIEGLQQAADTRLPEVLIRRRLKPFVEDELDALAPDTMRLLADPAAPLGMNAVLREAPPQPEQRVLLAVGPEGGWTDYERGLLTNHGFRAFSLGRRILRTDTACIALLSLLQDRLGTPG